MIGATVLSLFICCSSASADGTALGSYVPGFSRPVPPHPSAIDTEARSVGRRPLIVHIYRQWSQRLIVPAQLGPVWRRGSVPMITWEPLSYDGGRYPLRKIARGRYDHYLRKSAKAAAAFGHPILIRFAHEMNGSWYPWGIGVHGNSPARYKRAWRHVVEVFRSQGADEVEWVWAPQVNKDDKYPFERLFPGDAWVDWVALDGYNAGVHGNWDSFTEIFGPSYNTLVQLSGRPVLVTETGSSQSGGDKAKWVSSALEREIPGFSRLRGVVFFNARFNGLDFRIASSKSALRAFRQGVSSSRYDITRQEFLDARSAGHDRSLAPAAPSGDYGQPSLWYRLTQKLHGPYVWYAVAAAVAFALLIVLIVVTLRRMGRARVAHHR